MAKTIDPPMHTAEHLLNRTMVRMFGCERCFSAHIENKKSKCDYHFERSLKAEEIRQIEAMVNEIVAANLPVTESYQDREAVQSDFDLARLPDATEDRIRIVSIGGYDVCPCIGPHVSFTGEIGWFRITTTDFADGVLRIRFKLDRKAAPLGRKDQGPEDPTLI